jgi:hypothetical protein
MRDSLLDPRHHDQDQASTDCQQQSAPATASRPPLVAVAVVLIALAVDDIFGLCRNHLSARFGLAARPARSFLDILLTSRHGGMSAHTRRSVRRPPSLPVNRYSTQTRVCSPLASVVWLAAGGRATTPPSQRSTIRRPVAEIVPTVRSAAPRTLNARGRLASRQQAYLPPSPPSNPPPHHLDAGANAQVLFERAGGTEACR